MCAICGKTPVTGHSISHSAMKTKRRFLPNLQKIRVLVG
ncbi:MAG: 50S ribosomal protein L28, partial [bacterium]